MAVKIKIPITQCTRCGLSKTRRRVVVGRGSLPCDVLMIGEAPRAGEDLFDEAYTGELGNMLDGMLLDAGILPQFKVYRTYTTLCRPTDTKGGSNREPKGTEIIACAGNIMRIFQDASPNAIVLMGNIAEKAWKKTFPTSVKIQDLHFLLQTGGKRSPSYLKNIRILEDLCQQ